MSQDTDIASVIRKAEAQGFRHSFTSSNHHQFFAPNGKDIRRYVRHALRRARLGQLPGGHAPGWLHQRLVALRKILGGA
jgi:hypothetical protein